MNEVLGHSHTLIVWQLGRCNEIFCLCLRVSDEIKSLPATLDDRIFINPNVWLAIFDTCSGRICVQCLNKANIILSDKTSSDLAASQLMQQVEREFCRLIAIRRSREQGEYEVPLRRRSSRGCQCDSDLHFRITYLRHAGLSAIIFIRPAVSCSATEVNTP